MPLKKSPRRSLTAIAAVAAVAGAMLVIPTAAAPAFASDTTTATSLFNDVNAHRLSPSVGSSAVLANGFANMTSYERAVNYSHCASPCNIGGLPAPVDAVPSTPDAPDFDVPIYAHVSVGTHEASRLLTALLASSAPVVDFNLYNVAGVGVHTHGSKVYGVMDFLAYGTLPAGYLKFSEPTITGTVAVGHTLTVHYLPAVPDHGSSSGITYVVDWRSGISNYGSGTTFQVPASLYHQPIFAEVTAEKTGFVEHSRNSASTVPAAAGTFKVTGTPKMAQLFYGLLPSYSVSPSGSLAYKWYKDGHAILGQTSLAYEPVAGDIGHQITVKTTITDPGYTPKSIYISTAASFPGLQFWSTSAPVITGSDFVGDTLSASISAWSPSPTGTTIQWKANGVAISGATGTTLLLKHSMIGTKITVTYKSTLSLFETTSRTSANTAKIQAIG